jgi:hypothetical protein
MRNLLPLSAAVLAITALFACGDDDSSGSGAAAGNSGAGSTSGNAPANDCAARCAALPAACGLNASSCGQFCASITEQTLSCAESTSCDQAAFQACVGQGSGGSGGTGGSGGSGGSAGSPPVGGAGGSNGGNDCDQAGLETAGSCANFDGATETTFCGDQATQKSLVGCCRLTVRDGCTAVDTSNSGVTLFCCAAEASE